jgi:uncharacterized membrane protein YoaK (UPF0700 family)
MAGLKSMTGDVAYAADDREGPLPALLLILTMVTGLVDAVSYLALGHVFVANMTGNIVFLGFAVAGAQDFSIPASLVAIAAFLAGAFAGGRLGAVTAQHRGRFLAKAIYAEIALVGAALALSLVAFDRHAPQVASLDPLSYAQAVGYALIVLLALAMGLQNATARRLGVADLTTTVLTLTLTGLAADSTPAGGKNPRPGRRLLATVTMFLGAGIGALLLFKMGASAVLALALALLVVDGIAARRHSSSADAWTVEAR